LAELAFHIANLVIDEYSLFLPDCLLLLQLHDCINFYLYVLRSVDSAHAHFCTVSQRPWFGNTFRRYTCLINMLNQRTANHFCNSRSYYIDFLQSVDFINAFYTVSMFDNTYINTKMKMFNQRAANNFNICRFCSIFCFVLFCFVLLWTTRGERKDKEVRSGVET
jgi:hypothetical protein